MILEDTKKKIDKEAKDYNDGSEDYCNGVDERETRSMAYSSGWNDERFNFDNWVASQPV